MVVNKLLVLRGVALALAIVGTVSQGALCLAQPALAPPPPPNVTGPPRIANAADQPSAQDSRSLFESATIIGQVGNQTILAGDVEPLIKQGLAPYKDKMSEAEYKAQSKMFLAQALKSIIETKLLYLDFLRSLPDDKRDEALTNIRQKVNEAFYNNKLPELLKKSEMTSPAEYDTFLREYGSSLDKERKAFMERMMGQEMVRRNVDFQPYITHQQLLDNYKENAEEYEYPARARWQRLSVSFDKIPNKEEAYAAMAEMGNAVLRNAPFSQVARRSSHGINAGKGGFHDWTEEGSLRSEKIDKAIFSIPLNELSHVIEDDRGFHIVQVLEREAAGRTPFEEAQVKIKEKIRKAKVSEQIQEYVARLKKQTPVTTIFDPPEGKQGPVQAGRDGARLR